MTLLRTPADIGTLDFARATQSSVQDLRKAWDGYQAGNLQGYEDQGEQTSWTPEMAAARVVGRWRDGTPVSLSPYHESADISGDFYRRNGFRFVTPIGAATLTDDDGDHSFPGAVADPQAKACPFFGHIRKVNPRDQRHDFGGVGSTLSSQVLRRGVPFGPDWGGTPDGADRGLMFMSYQTSIQHGFYRLMSDWVKDPNRPIPGGLIR